MKLFRDGRYIVRIQLEKVNQILLLMWIWTQDFCLFCDAWEVTLILFAECRH